MGSAARTRLVRAWECATEGADPEEPNVMTAAMLRASCRLLDISDADASALVTQLLLGETSRSASPSSSPSSSSGGSSGSSGSSGRAEEGGKEGETKTAASPGAEGWIDFPQWVELVKPTMTMTMAMATMEGDTTTMTTSTTSTTTHGASTDTQTTPQQLPLAFRKSKKTPREGVVVKPAGRGEATAVE